MTDDLLGVGHLRQAQLLGHLRTHLRRIAVDGLAAGDDHVGHDLAQGARKGVGGGQRVGAGELAVGKQISPVGAAEHRVADDVGGTLRTHRQDVHRRALDGVLEPQGGLQRI